MDGAGKRKEGGLRFEIELGGILNCGWEIWGRTAVCLCLCALLAVLGKIRARFSKKKSRMHGVLNEVYLQNFSRMGVTFRDESNDGN